MTLPNLLSDTPLPDEDKTGLQDTAQDSRPEEQASFIRDALVLVDSFSRMITGIPDLRTYITIFHDKESSIFLLKDQKLTTTTSTPIINHLIAEMMKSGSATLFTDTSLRTPDFLGKPSGSSWLVIPLKSEHQIIGAIVFQGPKNGPYFAESDKQILNSLIEPISGLFQGVLLLQSTRQVLELQSQNVRAISRVQEDLTRLTDKLLETLDVDLVLETGVIELRQMFDLAEVEIQLHAT